MGSISNILSYINKERIDHLSNQQSQLFALINYIVDVNNLISQPIEDDDPHGTYWDGNLDDLTIDGGVF